MEDLVMVPIPPYEIAYASFIDREPTPAEYALMDEITEKYFDNLFQEFYSTDQANKALLAKYVSFDDRLNGTRFLPQSTDDYNIFMAYDSVASFKSSSATIPTADDIFALMVAGVDTDYIEFVYIKDSPFEVVYKVTIYPLSDAPVASPTSVPTVITEAPAPRSPRRRPIARQNRHRILKN